MHTGANNTTMNVTLNSVAALINLTAALGATG
jgi:hypothetical protein